MESPATLRPLIPAERIAERVAALGQEVAAALPRAT